MFKKGSNIFSLLVIVMSIFMTSSVNIVNAEGSSGSTGTTSAQTTQVADSSVLPGPGSDTTNSDTAAVTPTTRASKDFGSQFITSADLTDLNGNHKDPFDINDTMVATWTFSVKAGTDLKAGDTMTVPIPSQLGVIDNPKTFIINDDNGNKLADGVAKDNTITVTFTPEAEKQAVHGINNGKLSLQVKWNINEVLGKKEVQLKWTKDGTVTTGPADSNVTIQDNGPDSKEEVWKWATYDGQILHWVARINYAKRSIDNAAYTDNLGPNQELLPNTIKVYPVNYPNTSTSYYTKGDAVDLTNGKIKLSSTNKTGFKIDFGGTINSTYFVEYDSQITDDKTSSSYTNNGELTGTDYTSTSIPVVVPDGDASGSASTVPTVNISGQKTWDDDNNKDGVRPKQITVYLLRNNVKVQQKVVTPDANGDWKYEFDNLRKYVTDNSTEPNLYTVAEDTTDLPAGYMSTTSKNGVDLTNTYTKPESAKTSLNVIKKWNNDNDKSVTNPTSVTVHLLDNGKDTGKTIVLNEDNAWKGTFSDLTKSDNDKYTVEEDVPDGYTSAQDLDSETNTVTITNTHKAVTPPADTKTSLNVIKKWNNDNDKSVTNPTSVTVHLLDNGKDTGKTIVLNEDNAWKGTFSDLTKSDNDKYTVEEDVPDGYSSSQSLDSETNTVTITNTHKTVTPPADTKTSLNVIKKWNNDNDKSVTNPTSVTVHLLDNGKDTGKTIVLNEDNAWKGTFSDLTKSDNDKYTVKEDVPDGYTSTQDFDSKTNTVTITNTHKKVTPPTPSNDKTNLTVTKAWNDNNDNDKLRPNKVTVQLYANGVKSGDPITLNNDNDWSYTFDNLTKQANGKDITYTVKEVTKLDGYTTTIDNTDSHKIIITNTHKSTVNPPTPSKDKTDLTVTKAWNDNNDNDKLRPNKVTVQLYANGVKSGDPITLGNDNDWSYTFNNLAKQANGKDITYTVKEVTKLDGYTTTIDNTDSHNIIITNTHKTTNPPTPTKIKKVFTVKKIWSDNNNQDGLRPDSVKVQLLANGQKQGDPITLNDSNNWLYTWNNLDENVDYTVEEVGSIDGYTANVDKIDANNAVITNTHTPGTNNPGQGTGNPGNPGNPNPDQKTGTGYDKLPQTGAKALSWIYSMVGLIIIGLVATYVLKRKEN